MLWNIPQNFELWLFSYLPSMRRIQRETHHELTPQQKETISDAMYSAGAESRVSVAKEDKVYIGRYELAQIIEEDTFRCERLDVAESHHLAWVLAGVCGIRPQSLGTGKGKKGGKRYPTWRDVNITRGPVKASFQLEVRFCVPEYDIEP
jgi:hypothetical protein